METGIVVALVAAAVALTTSLLTAKYSRATIHEQRMAEKRKIIAKKLNEFYGPFISYSNVTKALYRIFARGKPKNFRTLTYLLDPEQPYDTGSDNRKVTLSENDRKILEEILAVEEKIERLVVEKGGLVDDPRLMFDYIPTPDRTDVHFEKGEVSLLALLITHFRVLSLAYHGQIVGETNRYQDFVYPREVDGVVRERFEKLQNELTKLGSGQVP